MPKLNIFDFMEICRDEGLISLKADRHKIIQRWKKYINQKYGKNHELCFRMNNKKIYWLDYYAFFPIKIKTSFKKPKELENGN